MSKALSIVFLLVASSVVSSPLRAEATTGVKRVAVLSQDDARLSRFQDSLHETFRELGYVEGKNIAFEYRFAAGSGEDLQSVAGALAHSGVDLIFALGTPSALAMSGASSTIPIVFVAADPVETGLVASLARPGGNTTGVTTLAAETGTKRLELLREVLPHAIKIAVLANPNNPATALQLKELESTAGKVGFKLRVFKVRRSQDLDDAFSAIRKQRLDAFVTVPDSMLNGNMDTVARLALKNRLPGISGHRMFAESGGLISYGSDYRELWRRCAVYADKIFKGAKPAELPVEQAAMFELVINLKTASAIGVAIPQSFLLRANAVIQ